MNRNLWNIDRLAANGVLRAEHPEILEFSRDLRPVELQVWRWADEAD
jgi:hypothetical protein